MTGKVKFMDGSKKGYGYIIETETNIEYYVHVSGTLDKIKEGDLVDFDLVEGDRGLKCINVKRVKK